MHAVNHAYAGKRGGRATRAPHALTWTWRNLKITEEPFIDVNMHRSVSVALMISYHEPNEI